MFQLSLQYILWKCYVCSFVLQITLLTRICDSASTSKDTIYTDVLDKSHTSGTNQ